MTHKKGKSGSILTAVENVEPLSDKPRTNDGERFVLREFGIEPHRVREIKYPFGVYMETTRKTEDRFLFLANAFARIISERRIDYGVEGLELDIVILIQLTFENGDITSIEMKAADFASGNFLIQKAGTRAVIAPGGTKPSLFRHYIQKASHADQTTVYSTVYGHTGFKRINGKNVYYLTHAGALTENGLDDSIIVDLGSPNLRQYAITLPNREALGDSWEAAQRFINIAPERRNIGLVLFLSVFRAILEEIEPVKMSLILIGTTGTFKTAVMQIAISFFGRGLVSCGPPISANSTPGAIEQNLCYTKDMLAFVDDMKSVTPRQSDAMNETVDRVLRNKANLSTRQRMGTTGEYPLRSMFAITAEELPRNKSALARAVILPFDQDMIPTDTLSACQADARCGKFENMAGCFIQWTLQDNRLDELAKTFGAEQRTFRDQLAQELGNAQSHKRENDNAANFLATVEVFIEFALDFGFMTRSEANDFAENAKTVLLELFGTQADFASDCDDAQRFISLISAALNAGTAHVGNKQDRGAPKDTERPSTKGWRLIPDDLTGVKQYHPCGQFIGFYNPPQDNQPDEIWLMPEAAWELVQQMANRQKTPMMTPRAGVWKMLYERGWLLSAGLEPNGRFRSTIKKQVAGIRQHFLVFDAKLIEFGFKYTAEDLKP